MLPDAGPAANNRPWPSTPRPAASCSTRAPRSVTASSTGGSTITLSNGAFTAADVGSTICGSNIPAGTTIAQVLSPTTAQLSAAVGTISSVPATIAQIPGDGGQFNAVTIDPATGNIVAAGEVLTTSFSSEGLVARLTTAGALDTSFDSTGYDVTFAPPSPLTTTLTDFYTVAVEPSGVPNVAEDIVAGGQSVVTGSQEAILAGFGSAGLDSNFGTAGIATPSGVSVVNGVTILADGNVVAVGVRRTDVSSFLPPAVPARRRPGHHVRHRRGDPGPGPRWDHRAAQRGRLRPLQRLPVRRRSCHCDRRATIGSNDARGSIQRRDRAANPFFGSGGLTQGPSTQCP